MVQPTAGCHNKSLNQKHEVKTLLLTLVLWQLAVGCTTSFLESHFRNYKLAQKLYRFIVRHKGMYMS